MATPGIPDAVEYLRSIANREGAAFDKDGVERIAKYAMHRVDFTEKEGGITFYVEHFLEALSNFYGMPFKVSEVERETIDSLIESMHAGWISKAGPGMTHGVWDHFKGGVYESDRLERDADTDGFRVSYRSHTTGEWNSRRVEQWNELVKWGDGKWRSRFILRTPPRT